MNPLRNTEHSTGKELGYSALKEALLYGDIHYQYWLRTAEILQSEDTKITMPFAEHLGSSRGVVDLQPPPPYISTFAEDLDSKSPGMDSESLTDIKHDRVRDNTDVGRSVIVSKRSRRQIWMVVCLTILFLISVAVALGVVLGVKPKARPSSNSTDQSTTTINGDVQNIAIAANTSLAAFDWIDASKIPHYRVIFQNTSNSIWQAERTSDSQSWTVGRVEGIGSVMPRTPLVAVGGSSGNAFVSLSNRRTPLCSAQVLLLTSAEYSAVLHRLLRSSQ